jgi:hypothetical protein
VGRVKRKLYKMKKLVFTVFAVGLGLTANLWAQVPNYVPTNGLEGWWPFNGNANDESGNGNNGTVNGATLSSDRFGNTNSSFHFDGINDWINMPSGSSTSMNITSNYTVSFWFKTTQGTNAGLIGFGDNINSNGGGYLVAIGNGNLNNPNGKLTAMTGSNWYTGVNQVIDNKWHFACVVLNQNSLKFIIDNVMDASFLNAQNPLSFNGLRAIGARNNGLAGYFNGNIDDIGIWNRALTDQEISDLYNANICYEHVTVTDTLVINTGITGYNPVTYKNTLKIWPNPTNDHITIDAGNLTTMNGYSIKIEDAQGQQVFQNAVNQQQFYVDITNWGGNGLYFVRIIDSQGNTVDIKKIVLQ